MRIALDVNGVAREVEASPGRRLLDVLRQDLGMTGTKEGCGEGECGACTVLVDDRPVCSCLVAVGQVHGRRVRTIEGLAGEGLAGEGLAGEGLAGEGLAGEGLAEGLAGKGQAGEEVLHAVQEALVRFGGTQCGICTPGIAMSAVHVLEREPGASPGRLRELLAGNLCRCTGYQAIIDAVLDAAARLQGGREG